MQLSIELMVAFSVAGLALVLAVIELIWLVRVSRHYNDLVKGADKKSLMSVLEGLQRTLATHEKGLLSGKADMQKVKSELASHLQHLTLKRFNPFSDTGGDQSFILAILDGNKDGVVITSLHSRENTRFYVKKVTGGVGVDHPLSADEQKIVNRRGE